MGKRSRNKKSRTGVMSTNDFLKKAVGGGGEFFNIKKEGGKAIAFIHPEIGFSIRPIHASSLPSRKKDEEGDYEYSNRRFNCAGDDCPNCLLMDFANQMIDDGYSETMRVLKGKKKTDSWSLEELAGLTDNYRKKMNVKKDFLFPLVFRTEDRDDEFPVRIFTAPISMATSVKKVIESQMEDLGEEEGDPMLNPYGFKFVFDDKASFNDMYTAERAGDKICPLDDETKEILEASPEDLNVDLTAILKPGDTKDMMKVIESCWVCKEIPFEEFENFIGVKDSDKEDPDDENDPDNDPDDPDDDEEETAKQKKARKLKEKKAKEKAKKDKGKSNKKEVYCDDCDEDVKPDKKGRCPQCRADLDVP